VRGEEDEYQCGERRGGRGTDSAETAEKPVSSGGSQRREDRGEGGADIQVTTHCTAAAWQGSRVVGVEGGGGRSEKSVLLRVEIRPRKTFTAGLWTSERESEAYQQYWNRYHGLRKLLKAERQARKKQEKVEGRPTNG
jgi:hypothetical protein